MTHARSTTRLRGANNHTARSGIFHQPLVSVVIVVKDDAQGLRRTLQSVVEQTIAVNDLDIVVMDGGDNDEVRIVAREYSYPRYAKRTKHTTRYIQRHDAGIYEGMNNGVTAAKGRWILFLNTDDVFADVRALETACNLALYAHRTDTDYVYVAMDFYEQWNGQRIARVAFDPRRDRAPVGTMPTSHQALFIRADEAYRVPFDTAYAVCADAHQYECVVKSGGALLVCRHALSIVNGEGFSTANFSRMMRERRRIQRDLYPGFFNWFKMRVFIVSAYAKRMLRTILPTKMWHFIKSGKHRTHAVQANYASISSIQEEHANICNENHPKPRVFWLTTVLDESAVSSIFFAIAPHMRAECDITFVSIQPPTSAWGVKKLAEYEIPLINLGCGRLQAGKAARALAAHIKECGADIVSAHLGRAYLVAALCKNTRVLRDYSVVLCATFHNMFRYFSPLTRAGLRMMLPRFDAVSAVSRACLSSYASLLSTPRAERVQSCVVYNPVARCIASRNPYTVQHAGRHPVVLCASRLYPNKGMKQVVDMASRLRFTHPHAHVYIAGDGPLRAALEQLTRRRGLESMVRFVGHVQDIHNYMRHADVVVYPSRSEGFGLVPCEAFLQKTPVVMRDAAVFRELYEHDAWFVDCDDADSMCAKVVDILQRQAGYQRLVMDEYTRISRMAGPKTIARDYCDWFFKIYSNCIDMSARS